MAMTKAAPDDWLSFEVAYEPDPDAEVAALVEMVAYSRDHGLAERYPTPEAVALAIGEREAHFRDCPTCAVGGPDGLCPDGRWYADRADRAMDDATAATAAGQASPTLAREETRAAG